MLGEQVKVWSAAMGLHARRVYVRNLRRQWGSCWPGGSLSFNYRLIMAPPHILDYVVVHELAHLQVRNHSPAFWSLVAAQIPAHRDARTWLRTRGSCLAI
jgi:predicted metal-dependent hydrolase